MTFGNLDQVDYGLHWFTSSYSSGAGGECVEVAMASKATHRTRGGGQCLARPDAMHVRDSKDPTRPGFRVGASAWTAFVSFATC
ncbi:MULTISPECIES: DUF397 domain-containing protein [unclassified Streptomyces]|uniref:DUF397 domain-containing protein n=1 Tax=unclassified Streptomyces TaxID=2593676 RepID=UPI0033204FBF